MFKMRFCFEKNGAAAYISHLDLMKALQQSSAQSANVTETDEDEFF